MTDYSKLDAWVDAHFDEEVRFLQELVRVPTDTPPGNNAPHAERTAELLRAFGMQAEAHPVPEQEVRDYGLQSITNLIVRREYGPGRRVALNAHGDVVPPGEGWRHDPTAPRSRMAICTAAPPPSARATSPASPSPCALEAVAAPRHGAVELHFTYDEEFGGLLGPGWLLRRGLTKPDLLIAAGFSYAVVSAHNGCLQMEVTVHGEMAHAAVPETGVDALQGAVRVLNALYAQNARYREVRSQVPGITHPYLNVGRIEGGTNTNVVPGKVSFKLDRRMIPEENAAEVEADIHRVIEDAAATFPASASRSSGCCWPTPCVRCPATSRWWTPSSGTAGRSSARTSGAGHPLYTDVRLYAEAGIPGVIYGAGPRTVLESHAKRNDERVALEDLRRATKVIARALADLLQPQ